MVVIKPNMVTTAFTIPGNRTVRNIGVVARSRSVIGSIGAVIPTLFGGNITLYTELCEQARGDAFKLMVEHAAQSGANAIVGMRWSSSRTALSNTTSSKDLWYDSSDLLVNPSESRPRIVNKRSLDTAM
jgi:uncharacterized protein YbjQ (UPF0145 family)